MVQTPRRHTLGMIAVLIASGAASRALPAAAQTTTAPPPAAATTPTNPTPATAFPSRPIRLIVPHAPGGNSDTFGRILAQKMGDRIGQQVVVENRPGAGGTLGSAMVSKSPPDGYTLVVADNGTHAIAPTLYGAKLNYDVFKDFTPITLAATFPTVIIVHPSVPAQNAQEFVALAKSQPGKLTYSSAGTGNGSHLTVELFRTAAGGLDMVHVPYKGGAPAVQALLAGEVQLSSVSVNTALPHIQAGKVRPLGMASTKRSPALPDVPTLKELGYDVVVDQWMALLSPAKVPAAILARLNAEVNTALRDPRLREIYAGVAMRPVGGTAQELGTLLQGEYRRFGTLTKELNFKAE